MSQRFTGYAAMKPSVSPARLAQKSASPRPANAAAPRGRHARLAVDTISISEEIRGAREVLAAVEEQRD